jgi:hypothetical protein
VPTAGGSSRERSSAGAKPPAGGSCWRRGFLPRHIQASVSFETGHSARSKARGPSAVPSVRLPPPPRGRGGCKQGGSASAGAPRGRGRACLEACSRRGRGRGFRGSAGVGACWAGQRPCRARPVGPGGRPQSVGPSKANKHHQGGWVVGGGGSSMRKGGCSGPRLGAGVAAGEPPRQGAEKGAQSLGYRRPHERRAAAGGPGRRWGARCVEGARGGSERGHKHVGRQGHGPA